MLICILKYKTINTYLLSIYYVDAKIYEKYKFKEKIQLFPCVCVQD